MNDWKRIQGAAKAQQQFLEKRVNKLNKKSGQHLDALQEKVETLYRDATARDCPDWLDVYNKIGDNLRKSDMTINLNSSSWFSKNNTYRRYTQTYQRNTDKTTGKTKLMDDSLNPAVIRATVDDRVTLPDHWRNASKFSQKRRLYDTMSFSGSALPEDPDAPMSADAKAYDQYHNFPKDDGRSKLQLAEKSAETTNRHFNADAKQVFAAINYGRRQHGSSTQYGCSYLILNPELKMKCLYFPGDWRRISSATSTLAGMCKRWCLRAKTMSPAKHGRRSSSTPMSGVGATTSVRSSTMADAHVAMNPPSDPFASHGVNGPGQVARIRRGAGGRAAGRRRHAAAPRRPT